MGFFGSIEKQYTMRITGGIGRGRKL
ncbi:MAG: hypothetical protein H6Q96_820, partial [Nitrospirae bacterium]|nr:hypothetical protein [Nitrospirota bacterium]